MKLMKHLIWKCSQSTHSTQYGKFHKTLYSFTYGVISSHKIKWHVQETSSSFHIPQTSMKQVASPWWHGDYGDMHSAFKGGQWIRWTGCLQNDTDNKWEYQKAKLKERRACSHLCTNLLLWLPGRGILNDKIMSGLHTNFSSLFKHFQQKWKFKTEI